MYVMKLGLLSRVERFPWQGELRIASEGGGAFGNIGFSGGGGLTPHGNGSLSGGGEGDCHPLVFGGCGGNLYNDGN